MTVWNDFFAHAHARKQADDNVRTLTAMTRDGLYAVVHGQRLLNLATNDYLALGTQTKLQQAFIQSLQDATGLLSSSSSPLLSGHTPWHSQVEHTLARLFQRSAALTFSSGYQMNLGLLSALADGHSLILADKYIHASMIDGVRLAAGRFMRYRHNDMAQLAALLQRHHRDYERILIVTESVFSMDGDVADLRQLVVFKRQYPNVALYVDEAHAIGVRGRTGLGCAQEQECVAEIDFLVGTFGKAIHSIGGYLLCSEAARSYLINHMRPLIFSTSLPPINMAWTDFVLQRLASWQPQRAHLQHISQRVITTVQQRWDYCPSQSHIIPVITGSNASALAQAAALTQRGLLVMAVRPPTVPANQARLRISLNAALSDEHIDYLLECL